MLNTSVAAGAIDPKEQTEKIPLQGLSARIKLLTLLLICDTSIFVKTLELPIPLKKSTHNKANFGNAVPLSRRQSRANTHMVEEKEDSNSFGILWEVIDIGSPIFQAPNWSWYKRRR